MPLGYFKLPVAGTAVPVPVTLLAPRFPAVPVTLLAPRFGAAVPVTPRAPLFLPAPAPATAPAPSPRPRPVSTFNEQMASSFKGKLPDKAKVQQVMATFKPITHEEIASRKVIVVGEQAEVVG